MNLCPHEARFQFDHFWYFYALIRKWQSFSKSVESGSHFQNL